MSDRQAMFKAAKAQRVSTALTKEQIKALKARKAQAAAEGEATAREEAEKQRKHDRALAAAKQNMSSLPAKPTPSGAMLPPAPRPPQSFSSLATNASVGSAPGFVHRTDSQKQHAGRNASIAPEPAGQSNASSGAVHHTNHEALPQQSEERSISSLPANFFDTPANSNGQQGSVGTVEMMGSNADMDSEVASALQRGTSLEAISASPTAITAGLPTDFFEAAGSNEGEARLTAMPETMANSQDDTEVEGSGPLPKGFFENKEADARARGIEPPNKRSKEEQYTDFMSSLVSEVRQVEAAEEAEAVSAAEEKAAREDFEKRVRLERIANLKNGQRDLSGAAILLQSEIEEVEVPHNYQTARRKRNHEKLDLVSGSDSSGQDEEEELDDLDWRAKTF